MKFANQVKINRRHETARRQQRMLAVVLIVFVTVMGVVLTGNAWDREVEMQLERDASAVHDLQLKSENNVIVHEEVNNND